MRGQDYNPAQDEPPDQLYVSRKSWSMLSDDARTFLIEAHAGGLRYIVYGNGTVLAWGPAPDVFSEVEVDLEENEHDGWLITPKSQQWMMRGNCNCGGENGEPGPIHDRPCSLLAWEGGRGRNAEFSCDECLSPWVPEGVEY